MAEDKVKDMLLNLINVHGDCFKTHPYIPCAYCPVDKCKYIAYTNTFPTQNRYELVINKFIELYGKDELLEILL